MESLLRDSDTSLESTQAEDKDNIIISSDALCSSSPLTEYKIHPTDDHISPARGKSQWGHFDPYDDSEVYCDTHGSSIVKKKKSELINCDINVYFK